MLQKSTTFRPFMRILIAFSQITSFARNNEIINAVSRMWATDGDSVVKMMLSPLDFLSAIITLSALPLVLLSFILGGVSPWNGPNSRTPLMGFSDIVLTVRTIVTSSIFYRFRRVSKNLSTFSCFCNQLIAMSSVVLLPGLSYCFAICPTVAIPSRSSLLNMPVVVLSRIFSCVLSILLVPTPHVLLALFVGTLAIFYTPTVDAPFAQCCQSIHAIFIPVKVLRGGRISLPASCTRPIGLIWQNTRLIVFQAISMDAQFTPRIQRIPVFPSPMKELKRRRLGLSTLRTTLITFWRSVLGRLPSTSLIAFPTYVVQVIDRASMRREKIKRCRLIISTLWAMFHCPLRWKLMGLGTFTGTLVVALTTHIMPTIFCLSCGEVLFRSKLVLSAMRTAFQRGGFIHNLTPSVSPLFCVLPGSQGHSSSSRLITPSLGNIPIISLFFPVAWKAEGETLS